MVHRFLLLHERVEQDRRKEPPLSAHCITRPADSKCNDEHRALAPRQAEPYLSPSSPPGSLPKAESQLPFQSVDRNTVWCESCGHRLSLHR